MKHVKTILPEGGVFPKFAPAVGTTGRVPCGVAVSVGKGDGVRKDNVGVTEPDVAVVTASNPTSVTVGRGWGGFRNVYTNPIPSRQRPINPQPSPANRNLSNVAKIFWEEFMNRYRIEKIILAETF